MSNYGQMPCGCNANSTAGCHHRNVSTASIYVSKSPGCQTAAEWLEELEAEETEWRRLLPGEKPVRGRLLAILRDAKAELERLSVDACAYCGARKDVDPPHVYVGRPLGWGIIEQRWREGGYK